MFYFSHVGELTITSGDIGKATHTDRLLSRVQEYITNGWPNKLPDSEAELNPFFVRRNELSVDQGCVTWERGL